MSNTVLVDLDLEKKIFSPVGLEAPLYDVNEANEPRSFTESHIEGRRGYS